MNNENLININDRTPEEQLAIRQAGGRAAAKSRTLRKQMRERIERMLAQKVKISPLHSFETDHTYQIDTDGTYYDEVCATILRGVLAGDKSSLNAFSWAMTGNGEQDDSE